MITSNGLNYTFGQYSGLGSYGNSNPQNDTTSLRTNAPSGSESNKGGGFFGFISNAGNLLDKFTNLRNAGGSNQAPVQNKSNNSGLIIGGVVALLVVVALVVYLNKSK